MPASPRKMVIPGCTAGAGRRRRAASSRRCCCRRSKHSSTRCSTHSTPSFQWHAGESGGAAPHRVAETSLVADDARRRDAAAAAAPPGGRRRSIRSARSRWSRLCRCPHLRRLLARRLLRRTRLRTRHWRARAERRPREPRGPEAAPESVELAWLGFSPCADGSTPPREDTSSPSRENGSRNVRLRDYATIGGHTRRPGAGPSCSRPTRYNPCRCAGVPPRPRSPRSKVRRSSPRPSETGGGMRSRTPVR